MKATLDDSPVGGNDEASRLFVLATLGDEAAANELYSRCVPPLRAWLAARVGWSMAEDVTHDALVVAFRKSGGFRRGAAFMPWLRTIAWNLAQKTLRHEARRQTWEREYHKTGHLLGGPDSGPEPRRRAALEACLAALPERQFELIRSRFCDGKSSEEIAAEQGRKRVAVAVSLHRVCKGLRADIERIIQSPAPVPH